MWFTIIFALLVTFFMIFLVFLAFRAFFLAFVKKKDERSKWIITKSMADSFITITILQTILCVIKWINYDNYQVWWHNFKEGLYIEPSLLNFIILGIILIINTKKYGGSL